MEIIAHRGWWLEPEEKNLEIAFKRALSNNYGIETDIRDYDEDLVISHDIANNDAMSVDTFFELYNSLNSNTCLALNIKSDGLAAMLLEKLKHHNIHNYFTFDMSIPDTLGYLKAEIPFYTRHSEYEPEAAFPEHRNGVWIDAFTESEIDLNYMKHILSMRQHVCLVSPELHGRPHSNIWEQLKTTLLSIPGEAKQLISLCTDLPQEAEDYFRN